MRLNQIVLEGEVIAMTEKGFLLRNGNLSIEVTDGHLPATEGDEVRIVGKLEKAGLIKSEHMEILKK